MAHYSPRICASHCNSCTFTAGVCGLSISCCSTPYLFRIESYDEENNLLTSEIVPGSTEFYLYPNHTAAEIKIYFQQANGNQWVLATQFSPFGSGPLTDCYANTTWDEFSAIQLDIDIQGAFAQLPDIPDDAARCASVLNGTYIIPSVGTPLAPAFFLAAEVSPILECEFNSDPDVYNFSIYRYLISVRPLEGCYVSVLIRFYNQGIDAPFSYDLSHYPDAASLINRVFLFYDSDRSLTYPLIFPCNPNGSTTIVPRMFTNDFNDQLLLTNTSSITITGVE